MSKKLVYGGVEVTPCDPRLPEILASIVELVRKSMGVQKVSHPRIRDYPVEETVKPDAVLRIEDFPKTLTDLDQSINSDHTFAFLYEDTLHLNKRGMTIADCINQPGFKVVDDEED